MHLGLQAAGRERERARASRGAPRARKAASGRRAASGLDRTKANTKTMGCGASKESRRRLDDGPPSRRYLLTPGGGPLDRHEPAGLGADGNGGNAGGGGGVNASPYLPSFGPLSAREYKARLASSEGTQVLDFPSAGFSIRYAFVSQRGLYPDSPDKPNQDALAVHPHFAGDPEQLFVGVFDGHGEAGTACAQFARDRVPEALARSPQFGSASGGSSAAGRGGQPALAFHSATVTVNQQLHRSAHDDTMSGTTCVALLLRGRQLWCANVGDSRAVLAERRPAPPGRTGVGGAAASSSSSPGAGYWAPGATADAASNGAGVCVADDLSLDQTPYRRDECERVKMAGARVLTLDQVEGLKDPTVECWTTEEEDDGDPPRLW